MKRNPSTAWLVGLLIPWLGMMGCGEGDVPFSPEAAEPEGTTEAPDQGILSLVATTLDDSEESPLAGVSIHGNYAYVGGMSIGFFTAANIGARIVDMSDPTNPTLGVAVSL